MQYIKQLIKYSSIVALLCAAMPLFAESAPVYDADSMQRQYENPGDNGFEDQAPAPSQEGAYVPQQMPQQAIPVPSQGAQLSLEQRTRRLEQQIANMQSSDSNAKVESLQSQLQSLRGEVDQLTRQLQQLQAQQKAMYADFDKRAMQQNTAKQPVLAASNDTAKSTKAIKAADSSTPDTSSSDNAATAVKAAADQPNVAEEQQIYQTAYNLIKAKKYNEAVDALQKMLQKYPSGQFAANAHYWLGELYGVLGKNDQALNEFNLVVKNYASSPRVSDAQLKVGLILASQSKWTEAKQAFKKVINRYPGSASARLASEQLKQIKQAGH